MPNQQESEFGVCEATDFGDSPKGRELAGQLILISATGEYTPAEVAQAVSILMATQMVTQLDDSAGSMEFLSSAMGMMQTALTLVEDTEWANEVRMRTRTVARVTAGDC